jgi:signal transduction histidine kinase
LPENPSRPTDRLKDRFRTDRLASLSLIYQGLALLIALVLTLTTLETDHRTLVLLYLLFMGIYLGIRAHRKDETTARWMLSFAYFTALIIGYFIPRYSWYEFLFLPIILLEIILLYPFAIAVTLEILMGMIGSVILSTHLLSDSMIVFGEVSLSLSLFSACFYTPLSLAFIVLAKYRYDRIVERTLLARAKELNKRLDGMNRNINRKLFTIQQESSHQERMRITKELHDTAGYVFINIIMLLQTAIALFESDRSLGESKIQDALDYSRRGMNEIRHILRETREYENPNLGLQHELFKIAELFKKATGVVVNMEYGNWPKTFGSELDMFFISFLQESLTNALKHGHATIIDMICWSRKDEVMILVKDNGRGADNPIEMGIGIAGIVEFVEKLSGRVEVSSDYTGFMIRITIPSEAIDAMYIDSQRDGGPVTFGMLDYEIEEIAP